MRNVLMIKEEETQLKDWEHHMEHHPACRADGEIHCHVTRYPITMLQEDQVFTEKLIMSYSVVSKKEINLQEEDIRSTCWQPSMAGGIRLRISFVINHAPWI